MWMWWKLAPARSLEAWEERLGGEPNLVLKLPPGGRSVRIEVYCHSAAAADGLHRRFGGRVRRVAQGEWTVPAVTRPPVKVRDRLLVVADAGRGGVGRWQREYPGREVVVIPAERAFGTGEHATTASCLRLLVDIARERGWAGRRATGGRKPSPGRARDRAGEAVADLGTGTGVLAVAARRLGAGSVWACDSDPQAVVVARRNVARNRVERVEVVACDVLRWQPPRRFEVVVANLFSDVLIEAMPVLAAALAPGGDLVVSGILRSQAWPVVVAAAGHGLGFHRAVRHGKWLTARGGWLAHAAP